jgi:fumarate reductase flavoprotein subunit
MPIPPKGSTGQPVHHADVSKREFLRAAGAATVALGLPTLGAAAGAPHTWDLIVVGGGNAGLPAAIFAAQRGARVLIVEAAGAIGGTLFLSSGQMSAAGTKLQRSQGIEDTPQSHYDDIMRISSGTADPVLVKLAVTNAAPVFDWLMDHGFTVLPGQPVTGTTHEPYSRARYAWGHEGGRSILNVLRAQLQPQIDAGRVTVLTGTEVVELIQDRGGSVQGVVTRDATGHTTRQLGHSTALTCGGYTHDASRFEKYEGVRNYSLATYPFSRGAGIDLAVAAGGYERGGDHHTPLFGAVLASTDYPSPMRALVRHFPPDRPPFEIFVNVAGKRFLCEDVPSHNAYEQGLRAQPKERCWVVFDDAIFHAAPPLATGGFGGPWTPADTAAAFENGIPMFFRAATLPELARAAGVDPDGLVATIADYNRAQASGQDSLGRKYMPLPIARPPFYAIQLQSWNLTSYGGIAVDGQLRVIRSDGTPIRNLYAAGELLGMGQMMGRSVCGGMSVTPALALGRLLGHEIVPLRA